ncbi:MAG: ComEC family competence protein [Marinilabiliaceae bacterium]|nr:ComEC family competence protein [Marinilabiliaceae bacterium]
MKKNNYSRLVKATLWSRLPILRIVAAMSLGIACSHYFALDHFVGSIVAMSIAIVVTMVALAFKGRELLRQSSVFMLMIGFFAYGLANGALHTRPIIAETGGSIVYGYVSKIVKHESQRCRVELFADSVVTSTTKYYAINGLLTIEDSTYLPHVGQRMCAVAEIIEPVNRNFGAFDYASYLRNNDIQFMSRTDNYELLPCDEQNLWTFIGSIRELVMNQLRRCNITEVNLSFIQALFLGDKSRLDAEVRQAFSDCGTIHVLAVSGLHVGIIYGLLYFIFSRTVARLSRKVSIVLILMGLWFYVLLTGCSPSVMRAALMMSAVSVAPLFDRETNVYNSLCIALFFILIVDPNALFSVGLWLSFLAVMGIVSMSPVLKLFYWPQNRVGQFIAGSLYVTLTAQLATLPVILYIFHQFPNYFIVNNLVLVSLAAPILYIVVLTLILSAVPIIGSLLGEYVVNGLVDFVMKYVDFASSMPYSVTRGIYFGTPELLALLMIVASIMALCIKGNLRSFVWLVRAVVVFCVVEMAVTVLESNKTDVTVFDAYGRTDIAVRQNGHVTHFLSDLEFNPLLTMVDNYNVKHRVASTQMKQIATGDVIIVGSTKISYICDWYDYDVVDDSTYCVVSADLLPPIGNVSHVHFINTQGVRNRHIWQRAVEREQVASVDYVSAINTYVFEPR